jgi:hypothetical protein
MSRLRNVVFVLISLSVGCTTENETVCPSTTATSGGAPPAATPSPTIAPSPSPIPDEDPEIYIDEITVNWDVVKDGDTYRVPINYPLALHVNWWSTDEETDVTPSLRVNWSDGPASRIHCGPCTVEHAYSRIGTYPVEVSLYNGVGPRALHDDAGPRARRGFTDIWTFTVVVYRP